MLQGFRKWAGCFCAASENITKDYVINHLSTGFSSILSVTGIQSVSKYSNGILQ